jgi:hypothetical protein
MTAPSTVRRILASVIGATSLLAVASPVANPAVTPAANADDVRPDVERRGGLPVPTTATVTTAELGPDSVVAVVTRGRLEQLNASGLAR